MSETKKKTASSKAAAKETATFSAEEREAMREAAAERRASAKGGDGEAAVLAKIAAMSAEDQALATGLHALVKRVAPDLTSKTYYGMPAYDRGGKTLFFLQVAGKWKTRYASLNFTDAAKLDADVMWPCSFAVTRWSSAVEAEVERLIALALR